MTTAETFEAYVNGLQADEKLDARGNRETIQRIIELVEKHNVLVLGHNYMHPLIYRLSPAGARGDSLALAKYAAEADAPVILFNGVWFMAETAKILNPSKQVLIASDQAGCSLADPIRAGEMRQLKREYPDVPIVAYINSYADLKAEMNGPYDTVCTSANAVDVIRRVRDQSGSSRIVFVPDTLMGKNLQYELDQLGERIDLVYPGKDNDLPEGKCEVHEKFTADQLRLIRAQHEIPKVDWGQNPEPQRLVMAHWECPPDVLREADFYGSTSQMAREIARLKPEKVYLATECEMAANLAGEFPETEFVRACAVFCSHMSQITLNGILRALEHLDAGTAYKAGHEVRLDERTRQRAYQPIERMLRA